MQPAEDEVPFWVAAIDPENIRGTGSIVVGDLVLKRGRVQDRSGVYVYDYIARRWKRATL